MNSPLLPPGCPDCEGVDRREFLKTTVAGGIGLASAAIAPSIVAPGSVLANRSTARSTSETLVATLYKSLDENQRKIVTFEFNHPLRFKVDNNWRITPPKISEFFTSDQQA